MEEEERILPHSLSRHLISALEDSVGEEDELGGDPDGCGYWQSALSHVNIILFLFFLPLPCLTVGGGI